MKETREPLQLDPVGTVTSPHRDRQSAPRQPAAARDSPGRITLFARSGYDHALADLEGWSHLWVLFWFHRNTGFRPKVAPPRSAKKRGVFATRSPYRPNPIGLSLVRLERVEGRVLHILDVDMLDGTPVLDLKPYLPYSDAAAGASNGWLEAPADPGPVYRVAFTSKAQEQLAWLAGEGVDWLRGQAEQVLGLGPAPHPYRRIKPDGDRMLVALKDFRMRFSVTGSIITIDSVHSGYKPRALADRRANPKAATPLAVHRRFVAHFGR